MVVSREPRDPRDLEQRLSAARPTPRPAFVETLEQRLLPPAAERRSRWRTRLAGTAVAGALATTLLVATLVGGNPFSASGTGDDVRAGDHCRFVERPAKILVPQATVDRRGEPE